MTTPPRIVEPGMRVGKLVVVKLEIEAAVKSLDKFLCQCDCGKTTLTRRTELVNGLKRSCGCGAKAAAREFTFGKAARK